MTERRMLMGEAGEEAAARALERAGWTILERRWRCRLGEIDIVARDGGTLVFVEVKARSSTRFGFPEEAVGRRKRGRLVRAALTYLKMRRLEDEALRFDVVAVEGGAVRRIEDAFTAEGYTY